MWTNPAGGGDHAKKTLTTYTAFTMIIKLLAAKIKGPCVHCMRQVNAYNAHNINGGYT